MGMAPRVTAGVVVTQLVAETAQHDAAIARSAASFDRNMGRMQTRSVAFGTMIGNAIGEGIGRTVVAIGGLVTGTNDFVQAWARLENRLKTTGLEGANLLQTMSQLNDIAMRQYVPVEALGILYQRLGMAQKALKTDSAEMLEFTDRVAGSLRLQGATAESARGALIQLTQAVGAGIVRAEEFNSMAEGALPILQAVSRGLIEAGGDVAKLRRLVVEGKVSSQAFFRAFLAGSQDLEQRLKSQTPTVEQAQTRLQNSLTETLGTIDKLTGASANYVRALGGIANAIDYIGERAKALRDSNGRGMFDVEGMIRDARAMMAPGNRVGGFAGYQGSQFQSFEQYGPPKPRDPVSINDFPAEVKKQKQARLDAFQREQREFTERMAMIEAEIAAVGRSEQARDKERAVVELTNMAKRAGKEFTPELLASIDQQAERYARLNEQLRQARANQQAWYELQKTFGQEMIQGIEGLIDGTKKWNDVLADTLKTFARMALQAAILGQGPMGQLFGLAGAGGAPGGLIGGLFGGFRADGGPVAQGKAYMVGERGPEMFVPGRSGAILPNHALRPGGANGASGTYVVNADLRDSSSPAIAVLMQRLDRLEANMPRMIEKSQAYGRQNNPFYGQ